MIARGVSEPPLQKVRGVLVFAQAKETPLQVKQYDRRSPSAGRLVSELVESHVQLEYVNPGISQHPELPPPHMLQH